MIYFLDNQIGNLEYLKEKKKKTGKFRVESVDYCRSKGGEEGGGSGGGGLHSECRPKANETDQWHNI